MNGRNPFLICYRAVLVFIVVIALTVTVVSFLDCISGSSQQLEQGLVDEVRVEVKTEGTGELQEDYLENSLEQAIQDTALLSPADFKFLGIFQVVTAKDESELPEKLYANMKAIPGVVAYASTDVIPEGTLIYIQGQGIYQVHALKEHSDFVFILPGCQESTFSAPIFSVNQD